MTDMLLGLGPIAEDARKPSEKVEELVPEPADEAIDEFFALHKSGDLKGAREAFRSAVRICAKEDNDVDGDEAF